MVGIYLIVHFVCQHTAQDEFAPLQPHRHHACIRPQQSRDLRQRRLLHIPLDEYGSRLLWQQRECAVQQFDQSFAFSSPLGLIRCAASRLYFLSQRKHTLRAMPESHCLRLLISRKAYSLRHASNSVSCARSSATSLFPVIFAQSPTRRARSSTDIKGVSVIAMICSSMICPRCR